MGTKVQIDYRRAQQLAEIIENRAGEIRKCAATLETDIATEVEACWQEDGDFAPSKMLVADIRTRVANMNRQADRLVEIAHAMSKTADQFRLAHSD